MEEPFFTNLFEVNTKKEDSKLTPDQPSVYITALNTKRNPDLLIPGGALKGNMYFKKTNGVDVEDGETKSQEDLPEPVEGEDSTEDDYKKLKAQVSRYFADSNPTIKCRNCKTFGHMARDCPNERKGLNCILCGKDTHDSFECNEKLCFKCNKVGHKATECQARNIETCQHCGIVGHAQIRCLKVWSTNTATRQSNEESRYSAKIKPFMRCMECGKQGHMRCTNIGKSIKMKLSFRV